MNTPWFTCTDCIFASNSQKLANAHDDQHPDHTIKEETL